jgi:hypothetical protein
LVTTPDPDSEGGNPRIEALVATTDGFRDRELVVQARETAFEIVDADPLLQKNAVLADELTLLFSSDDEAFLFKS